MSSGIKSTDVLFAALSLWPALQLWVLTTGERSVQTLAAVQSTGDKTNPDLSTLCQAISYIQEGFHKLSLELLLKHVWDQADLLQPDGQSRDGQVDLGAGRRLLRGQEDREGGVAGPQGLLAHGPVARPRGGRQDHRAVDGNRQVLRKEVRSGRQGRAGGRPGGPGRRPGLRLLGRAGQGDEGA